MDVTGATLQPNIYELRQDVTELKLEVTIEWASFEAESLLLI